MRPECPRGLEHLDSIIYGRNLRKKTHLSTSVYCTYCFETWFVDVYSELDWNFDHILSYISLKSSMPKACPWSQSKM